LLNLRRHNTAAVFIQTVAARCLSMSN